MLTPVPSDRNLQTSDVTTNDASTTKHGFLKKLSGVATEFMNGVGSWVASFTAATPIDVIDAGRFAADAGANDTYAATLSPAITAYVTGCHYRFRANTANTGAATLNLNGLGAKTIKKAAGGITTDLATNDIRAGQWVDVVYDGTNFQMQSGSGNAAAGGVPTEITVADTTDTSCFLALFESATGDLGPKTDAGVTYDASTGVVSTTGIVTGSAGAVLTGGITTVRSLSQFLIKDYDDATKVVSFDISNVATATSIAITFPGTAGTLATLAGTEAFTNKTYNGVTVVASVGVISLNDFTLTLGASCVLGGTNTGDQTSIVGITGTAAQFDAAMTDANFLTTISKVDAIDAACFAADAGSTDTYVATLSPAISAYVTGCHYRFKANTANTGACTLNLNSLGAKTIKKAAGGITTDLADNDIRAGQWVDLVYDGTNFQMQSPSGNAPAGGSESAANNVLRFERFF